MTNYVQARITNPSHYFETPGQVLSDVELGHADKVKILKSMAVDADQKLEATSEGMAGSNRSYDAKDLQTALVHLEHVKDVEGVDITDVQTARFQRIVVVTTVDQHLNCEIAGVAFDMAETAGGKVCLLSVVPTAFEGAGLVAAAPMVTAVPFVANDDAQIIEDRREQLAELEASCGSSVETEIEVRSAAARSKRQLSPTLMNVKPISSSSGLRTDPGLKRCLKHLLTAELQDRPLVRFWSCQSQHNPFPMIENRPANIY